MADNSSDGDSDAECPFLLKLFYQTGSFHSPNEFASADHGPAHVLIYTFLTCTLRDLVYHLAAADKNILPSPAIGTRVVFRLVSADTRAAVEGGGEGGGGAGPTRFVVRDLGSVVIGGGKAASTAAGAVRNSANDANHHDGQDYNNGNGNDHDGQDYNNGNDHGGQDYNNGNDHGGQDYNNGNVHDDGHKTLTQARFFVGDYISCAILPPLDSGRVAPASHARQGADIAISGMGEGRHRAVPMQPPPPQAPGFPRGPSGRGGGRGGWNGGGGGGGGRWHDGGRLPNRGSGVGSGNGVLANDWRRGERPPDGPARTRRRPGRGSGGGGGRW